MYSDCKNLNWHSTVKNQILRDNICEYLNKLSDYLISDDVISKENLSLLNGCTGSAIFFAINYKVTNNIEDYRKCNKLVEFIINNVYNYKAPPTFASGIAGIGWALCYLERKGLIELDKDFFNEVDNFIINASIAELKFKLNYDFLHGGIGYGIYLLERHKNKSVQIALSTFIDELHKISIQTNNKYVWIDQFNKQFETVDYDSSYNLGLAHGMPSIIIFLSLLYKLGIQKEKVYRIISGCISWILEQQNDSKNFSNLFPTRIKDNIKSNPARLSWCYGDLGIAWAILNSGLLLNEETWITKGIEIALNSAKIKGEELILPDAIICHGTLGNAHFFNRFYHKTSIIEFKNASELWFNSTFLKQRDDDTSLFKTYRPALSQFEISPGLLEGNAGIGLIFLSLINNIEPDWDRCLLLS